jgi:hypothetical protein
VRLGDKLIFKILLRVDVSCMFPVFSRHPRGIATVQTNRRLGLADSQHRMLSTRRVRRY